MPALEHIPSVALGIGTGPGRAVCRRKRLGRALVTIAVAGVLGSPGCLDLAAPGSHAPSRVTLSLALPEATPVVWLPVGESLYVAVRRAGRAEPIVDSGLVIEGSLSAALEIPMAYSQESFVAAAEVLYSGSVYFLAFEALRLHAGADTTFELQAVYVGPGARAASYALGLRDSTLRRGDTTSVVPLVMDSAGQMIENVPARYLSHRPAVVTVDTAGIVQAQPVPPDTASIAGFLPTGLSDSMLVRVLSRAASIAPASGDDQTGARLRALAAPLVVLVLDDEDEPVVGEPVRFTTDEADGSFHPAVSLTDSAGRAASFWTLGADLGAQGAQATVEDLSPVSFTATAVRPAVESVRVEPPLAQIGVAGGIQQFVATALDDRDEAVEGMTFEWESSTPSVATVDAAGLATARAKGTTTITATAEGVTGSAELTVLIPTVEATEDIVFISTRDGSREVYAMNADGSGARRITNSTADEHRPAWAPDRSAIVFEREVDGLRQIFRISGGATDEAQLTTDGENTRPRFSPDGTRIAFTSTRNGQADVWVMAHDGSGQRRLVDSGSLDDDPDAEYQIGDYFGDWSPDGTKIVFVRYECPEGCWSELKYADSAGVEIDGVIHGNEPSVAHSVRWSPQGWRIAMTEEPSGGDTTLASASVNDPNGDLPDHSPSFDANAAYAGAWDRVVFESEDASVHGIYIGNLGSAATRLSPGELAEHEPDHVPPATMSVLTAVTIGGDTITAFDPGETRQLSGMAYDQNGSSITAENLFEWWVNPTYPDYLVAQVDAAGLVTGRAGGRARVVLWYIDGVTDTATVAVNHVPGTWAPAALMSEARYGHAGALLNDGRVLVTGGITGYAGPGNPIVASSVELYDPATGTTSATGGMRAFRWEHTATTLNDGRVLIVGGRYGGLVRTVQRTAELYDPSTGTTAYTDSVGEGDNACCTGRRFHTATRLLDGRVLIAGGGGATSSNQSYALRSAELYDPATGNFTPTGQMNIARQRHTATLLADGRVLLVGGYGSSAQWGFVSAEVYDPASGTFSVTGSLAVERREHAAVALADGRVLIIGGYDYAVRRSESAVEVYDPATGLFTVTGSLVVGRWNHQATLLPDGRVLVTGGLGSPVGSYFPSNTAEVYDPAAGMFTATGNMLRSRDTHVQLLLQNGLIAVIGGTGGNLGREIELYRP